MNKLRLLLSSLLVIALAVTVVNCGSDHHNTITNQLAFLQCPTNSCYAGGDSVILINNDGSAPITVGSGLPYIDSVSEAPDGKSGVFIALDTTTNVWQVFSANLSNQKNPVTTQLTTDAVYHYSAQISWDGKTVVYSKETNSYDQIATMSTSGGAETVIATPYYAEMPSFTPGGQIVYVNESSSPAIYVMNTDGSGNTQLTTPPSGQYDWAPAVSADGKTLTFTRCSSGCDVWTANVDGTNPKALTTDGMSYESRFINNKIVYCSTANSTHQLYSMNPDGSSPTRITNDSNNDELNDWFWD